MRFSFSEYHSIAKTMRSLKGKAMLSINDHPAIRECFDGFHMESLDIVYQVAGGDSPAPRRELVIWSWDPADEPAGLF